MMSISNPIHEPQDYISGMTFPRMVFEQDRYSGDALCLGEQNYWICCVVQDIDKHDDIERLIVERKAKAIKLAHGNVRLGTNQDINTTDGQIGARAEEMPGDCAFAATYIEQRFCFGRDSLCKFIGNGR